MGKDKDTKKQTKKGMPLQTFQQSLAYTQQTQKQAKALMQTTKTSISRLGQIERDKNYLAIFKKVEQNNPLSFKHPLDSLEDFTYQFDQKLKKDHFYSTKLRMSTKQQYKFPLTSSQVYGWRPSIDAFNTGHGLKTNADVSITKPQKKQKK